MGSSLMLVAAGFQMMQGISGYQQNKAMASAAEAQTAANIANQQKATDLQLGQTATSYDVKKTQLRRTQAQEAGKQRALAAGSGATLGSFDALFEDTSRMSAVDMALLEYDKNVETQNIKFNSDVSVAGMQNSGNAKATEYKIAAKSSLLSGVSGAAQSYGTSKAMNK